MGIKILVGKFCKKVYNKLNEQEFIEVSKMQKRDFTRKRKLGFSGTILMVLNKTGKSLQTGIRAFMKSMQLEAESYSKQAFSKGRLRVKYEAFREIFRMSVNEFYQEFKPKTYKGYRVCAVDGTKLNLPYNEESKTEFGIQDGHGDTIQALGSCLYDVINEFIIDAQIVSCNGNERELAQEHLKYLSSIRTAKELIIFDRGYPSAELIDFIEKNGFQYLMRCDRTFVRGMLPKLTGDDCVITHKFVRSKIEVKLRFITITLPDGNTEFLITNLFDSSFKMQDFAELYHLRLEIETSYDDIKNKLEIENFSGTSSLAIKQDFFATMFLRNLASMMIFENADVINEMHNNRDNKLEYKANVNTVISILKTDLIEMLVTDSKRKRSALFKKIYFEISRAVVPIRPDRSFPRKKSHFHSKFNQNQKS